MNRYGMCMLLLLVGNTWADTVFLKSGAAMTGEIVGEDAYEVQLLVSRTQAGDIRTVKIIDQDSVESLQRDAPEVGTEPEPQVAGEASGAAQAVSEPAPLLVEPEAMEGALKRADALTGEGRYDEAIRAYRAVIDAAERQADTLRASPGASERGMRLDMLRMREETYALLLIALQGRLELKRATLTEAEARVQQLTRAMVQTRDELDDLTRESKTGADAMRVRRLGAGSDVPATATRIRDLQVRQAAQERQVQEQHQRLAEARGAIVNLESEIQVAREKSRQAEDEFTQTQREYRARR